MPINLIKVSKTYKDIPIFKDFSFEFKERDIYVLTGKVGIGKTTLLNIISANESIDSGEITGLENKKISYVFQDNRLLREKTVFENMMFVLKDKLSKIDSKIVINKYLEMFNLLDYKDYVVNELSGGMQKKLVIARALVIPDFNVLLLDEPFNNIDDRDIINVMEIIMSNIPKETIVILATHNLKHIHNYTDKIYILESSPTNNLKIKSTGDK